MEDYQLILKHEMLTRDPSPWKIIKWSFTIENYLEILHNSRSSSDPLPWKTIWISFTMEDHQVILQHGRLSSDPLPRKNIQQFLTLTVSRLGTPRWTKTSDLVPRQSRSGPNFLVQDQSLIDLTNAIKRRTSHPIPQQRKMPFGTKYQSLRSANSSSTKCRYQGSKFCCNLRLRQLQQSRTITTFQRIGSEFTLPVLNLNLSELKNTSYKQPKH